VLVLLKNRDLLALLELFENAEGHQRYNALAVGRVFPDFYAFVCFVLTLTCDSVRVGVLSLVITLGFEDLGNGRNGFASQIHMVFQVLEFQKSTEVLGHFDDFLGDSAGVKACFAFFG